MRALDKEFYPAKKYTTLYLSSEDANENKTGTATFQFDLPRAIHNVKKIKIHELTLPNLFKPFRAGADSIVTFSLDNHEYKVDLKDYIIDSSNIVRLGELMSAERKVALSVLTSWNTYTQQIEFRTTVSLDFKGRAELGTPDALSVMGLGAHVSTGLLDTRRYGNETKINQSIGGVTYTYLTTSNIAVRFKGQDYLYIRSSLPIVNHHSKIESRERKNILAKLFIQGYGGATSYTSDYFHEQHALTDLSSLWISFNYLDGAYPEFNAASWSMSLRVWYDG